MTNVVFDILARDKASKVFDKVGRSAEKTGGTFHKVGQAAGVALAGGLTLAAAGALKATKAAAEDQQAASRLAQTLQKATGATKGQIAANEQWITAQGKAYGVTDDDLRPAISRLAVATGSLSKAQKLAKLAMDVSAGSGKSLASVSLALAKAQNGSVSGLARLGVKTQIITKDTVALRKAQIAAKQAQLTYTAAVKAHGKHSAEAVIAAGKLKVAQDAVATAQTKTKKTTMTMSQVTKELAAQYGGAAAKNAETAAGKQKILQVQMKELQEQIGAGLLPVLLKLATIGLSVVSWISKNTKVAGILAGVLGGLLAVTWAVGAATKAWAAITKVAEAAQWLLNAALDANPIGLVVIALAALAVGLVIAYKHSETFRKIVKAAFHGVQAVAASVAGFFTRQVPAAFAKVKDAASSVLGWVKGHWPLLLAILTGPFGLAVLVIAKNWGKIKDGATAVVGFIKDRFNGFVDFVSSIPGRLANLAGQFLSAGRSFGGSIIHGMISGLQSVSGTLGGIITAVKNAVNSALHLPLQVNIDKGPFHLHATVIPALAKGTRSFAGGLALVGEQGPEIVSMPRGTRVYPNGTGPTFPAETGRASGGGVTINITVNASRLVDPKGVAAEIEQELTKLKNQRGGRALAFI